MNRASKFHLSRNERKKKRGMEGKRERAVGKSGEGVALNETVARNHERRTLKNR